MPLFQFKPSPSVTGVPKGNLGSKCWQILIVDDDESIHEITELVLANVVVDSIPIKLIHAYSAAEAKTLLSEHPNICMAFIDIVMETEHAGLELVTWIRQIQNNAHMRLILRTGQPGSAPEEEIIKKYDINDYRTKTEFTALKMQTAVQVGVRGYRDMTTISRSLTSFKKLIESSTSILKIHDVAYFANAALENLLILLNITESTVYIVRRETDIDLETQEVVLARTAHSGIVEECSSRLSTDIKAKIETAFLSKNSYQDELCFISFNSPSPNSSTVLYIELTNRTDQIDTAIIEVYATTVAIILENISRQQQLESNQRELLYVVGESIEARSKETGNHVKRVALICKLLATKLGLPESYVNNIHIAAPLHDVGKIAIPEHILHKPGKLTAEEWAIMQTHAELGAELISRSDLPVAKLAARLAHYHHENWDGSGYPDGLAGETIPLEARIMAVADVIDALGSKRSYKEPWPEQEILDYLRAQSGIKFEPKLVEIACTHFSELLAIRDQYPD